MLEARDLSVNAGDVSLLDELSVTASPGRVTAIVGPNGAGKSTLLACLAGLRTPSRGHALIDGEGLAARSQADRARRIGYLPQESPIHWNVSVRALVALGRYPHRLGMAGESAADRAAVDHALEETNLSGLADRSIGTLSGGERARALLARVLAGEPAWILADEPMAALDLSHRYALMALLRGLAKRGTGVLVVLHDLALAARMADDAILLDKGRVIAVGPASAVLIPEHLGPVFGADFAFAAAPDGSSVLISTPSAP